MPAAVILHKFFAAGPTVINGPYRDVTLRQLCWRSG